jgi:hypothetical protein
MNNEEITTLYIPNTITEIYPFMLSYTSGLTSVIIPNSVTRIGRSAFCGCKDLINVSLSNGITEICDYAFVNSNLEHIIIPDSVITLGNYIFEYCSNLKSIVIGKSVSNFGDKLYNFPSGSVGVLEEMTVLIENPTSVKNSTFEYINKSIPLYVPKGTKSVYESTEGWNQFTNIIELSE